MLIGIACCLTLLLDAPAAPRPVVIVVAGAAGSPEYGKQFQDWSSRWQTAAQRGGAEFVAVGLEAVGAETDHDRLQRVIADRAATSDEPLWLVFIGHGTFDGKVARFNLRGPDVTLPEISAWLQPVRRPLAVINCASCSGPFLQDLAGPERIVITSTKSGSEYNFSRFGDYLSAAIIDPNADLDRDDQVSLLEAYLRAAARVSEFYEGEGRLMTEHALLDDNGDRLGTPADWFQGVRAVKSAKSGALVDGQRAHQWHLIPSPAEAQLSPEFRRRRNELEQQLAQQRLKKEELSEAEYLAVIEPLLIELAKLYEAKADAK